MPGLERAVVDRLVQAAGEDPANVSPQMSKLLGSLLLRIGEQEGVIEEQRRHIRGQSRAQVRAAREAKEMRERIVRDGQMELGEGDGDQGGVFHV